VREPARASPRRSRLRSAVVKMPPPPPLPIEPAVDLGPGLKFYGDYQKRTLAGLPP